MTKRILSLLLVLVFVFSFAACGDNETESTVDTGVTSIADGADEGETSDTESTASETSSNQKTSTNTSTANSSKPTSSKKTDTGIDYDKLKGTTVKILMWRALTNQEKAAIKSIEKQYSITVKTEVATSNYMSKVASLVSTKNSPDIAMIPGGKGTQGAFPLGAAALFQPAKVTKQDFSDDFWNHEFMNSYKIKGQYFAIGAENANWYNCFTCLFYNADMFATDKIETPYSLWKKGNWNWDTLRSTADALKAKGHDYAIQADQQDNFMFSTGIEFVSYKDGKFINNMSDNRIVKAWTLETQLVEAGLMPKYGTQTNAFTTGKAGMIATNLWAMRKGEMLQTATFKIECVPFPSPKGSDVYVGGSINKFAIPKGAKNPVGAGVFLREFLDAKYNGNFADVAMNTQYEEIFKYLNSNAVKQNYLYNDGVVGYSNVTAMKQIYSDLHGAAPSQVTTVLQKHNNVVQNAVNTANKKLGN